MNKMDNFARILINELVDKDTSKGDVRLFLKRFGIDSSKLNDADEIWKLFVRYNLDTGGMKSRIVEASWNEIPIRSVLKQRTRLLESMAPLKQKFIDGQLQCYSNFSQNCHIVFSQSNGFTNIKCLDAKVISECPVIEITKEIQWHRKHYKIAKIIAECAKRLLIEDEIGKQNGNLNDIVNAIFDKCRNYGDNWKTIATEEFISRFNNIRDYGSPPKVIIWMLSDLSSPIHQINHWPDVDLSQLTPVDTHVQRLMVRLGFIRNDQVSNENIRRRLNELYPQEPRKLDFALYRLGGELEENICRKEPDCRTCKDRFPNIYEECPSRDKTSIFQTINYSEGENIALFAVTTAERKEGYVKRFFIDESKHSLESRLGLVNASGDIRSLLEKFNQGISRLAEELNKNLFAKTHIYGLTYYVNQKAFIFLNIRQSFLALKFYTNRSSIEGLQKANWIQGEDRSGSETFRVIDDTTLEKALNFAKQSIMITSSLFDD